MAILTTPEQVRPAQPLAPAHRGLAVWFTGLSGAGKTTLCRSLEQELRSDGYRVQVLDADEVRQHLGSDLGFSKEDRDENISRIGYVARLLVHQDVIVLVAAISPYRVAREKVRHDIGRFLEIYVNASLEACIQRDPKQLYARALRGEISHFTGIDDPYEAPLHPDVECNTEHEGCAESTARVLSVLRTVLEKMD